MCALPRHSRSRRLPAPLPACPRARRQEHTQAEAVDGDVFHWRVRFRKEGFSGTLRRQLQECANQYGDDCGCITLEFNFPHGLYPNFPPTVKLVRPRCATQSSPPAPRPPPPRPAIRR